MRLSYKPLHKASPAISLKANAAIARMASWLMRPKDFRVRCARSLIHCDHAAGSGTFRLSNGVNKQGRWRLASIASAITIQRQLAHRTIDVDIARKNITRSCIWMHRCIWIRGSSSRFGQTNNIAEKLGRN